jgi:signal transduction histidine kinase
VKSLFRLIGQVLSGLRFRLLVLVVFTCAPLVVLIIHTSGEDRRRAMTSWEQRAQRVQQISQREEQEVIGGTRQLLLAIAESSPVASLNPRSCKRWLDEVFNSYQRFANLGLIRTNGEVIACHLPMAEPEHLAERPFFRRAIETRHLAIEVPAGRTNGPASIHFGSPVLDASGQVMAVVFAELDANWLDRSAELAAQLPRAGIFTEIDRNGTILARYPKPGAWLGRAMPESWLVTNVFVQNPSVLEGPDQAGVLSFYAFGVRPSRLIPGDVATILSIHRNVLFADADRVLRRNLTWLGLAAAMALSFGWIGSRLLILRPVRAVANFTARLAAGDFSVRGRLHPSRDELGQLTLAFDQMAQALERRELEYRRASHKLQTLSRRLVQVQETERRNIARELHDEIGQSLTAAELNLQAALQSPGAAALERRLEESIKAVERVLEQVHDLSLNLRPSMLDDLGLEPALRWYTRRQADLTGMAADFEAETLPERLDPVIETECFRIAQEALTNVVRHSRARAVSVAVSRRDGHLHLSVRDDGVGFDVVAFRGEAVRGASLGLLSMEERASLAGGGLELNSAPGRGTEVHAWFPLRWRSATLVCEHDEQHQ